MLAWRLVEELATQKWKEGYEDEWPVQRAFPVQ